MAFELKCKPMNWTRISQHFTSKHKGIDLAAPTGTKIVAAAPGKVYAAGNSPMDSKGSYGLQVVIAHEDGYYTTYAHCSKLTVKKGDTVAAGDKIAECGSTGNSTGPHCHFEVRTKLAAANRVDPEPFLEAIGKPKKEEPKKEPAKKEEPKKEAPKYNYKVKTSGSRLRVRSKANTNRDSLILTTLANGTKLHVVKFEGKMAKIDKPAKGYVSKTYIGKI